MKLENGKFYKDSEGRPVKAQIEADGKFHCYNCEGNSVGDAMAPDTHVEGWIPIGRVAFSDAAAKAEEEKKTPAKPAKKKAEESKTES